MKQEEFNQDNQPKINLEGIELPLFNNISTNEEETSSFRNLINVESLPTNFVNKQEEEEQNSEDKTLNPQCVELPEKDEYLRKKKYLGEFFLEEDKAEARANLGITPLLAELKAIIEAKLVDETGNLKFGLEPTNGAENEEAYGQVLSSAIIYNTLQKYYTKNELDNQSDVIFNLINQLKNEKVDESDVYTKGEIDNLIINKQFVNKIELFIHEKLISYGLAKVAETGDYNDLFNKPVNISEFFNDVNYLRPVDIISKAEKSEVYTKEEIDLSQVQQDEEINILNNKVDANKADIEAKLELEIADITSIENNLQTAIDNEIARATGIENSLRTDLTTTQTNLQNEINRAILKEKELNGADIASCNIASDATISVTRNNGNVITFVSAQQINLLAGEF